MTIHEEVAAAMKWARERCQMTPEQFAREINRVAGDPLDGLDGLALEMIEAGETYVNASWLVAAARLAEQPVSVALGELELYEVTIPSLEFRLTALEAAVEKAGLGPQS